MSNLLIDDRPIMFLPSLAKALGSCERAIVLQQIHWLLRLPNSGVDEEGYHWVYGTYEEWCRDYFTMWQARTLKMHILNLEKQGVLISAQLREKQHDQTKFYRIYYAHELLNRGSVQDHVPSSGHDAVASSGHDDVRSIYSTKTSAKNSPDEDRPSRAQAKKSTYRPPSDIDPLSH